MEDGEFSASCSHWVIPIVLAPGGCFGKEAVCGAQWHYCLFLVCNCEYATLWTLDAVIPLAMCVPHWLNLQAICWQQEFSFVGERETPQTTA